ncbi:hypothetical protein CJF32_00000230 [Rutstroemia sp. NJR-2017a WRK4]|nr:hypothetical protein CJF32_00000230 [Rutstroemia sp. NJR-2017a WRK4]
MKFVCSMSRSIDPRRPRKLTAMQSASVNGLLCIVKLEKRIAIRSRARGDLDGEERYQQATYRHLSRVVMQRSAECSSEIHSRSHYFRLY